MAEQSAKDYLLGLSQMDVSELDAELESVSAHDFKKKLTLGIEEIYRDAQHLCADVKMVVDSRTLMITDFGKYTDMDVIYEHVLNLSIGNQEQITEAMAYLRPMFDEWSEQGKFTSSQQLLVMSTVFPIRVLASIIQRMKKE